MAQYQMPDGNLYNFESDDEATLAMESWQKQFGSTSVGEDIKLGLVNAARPFVQAGYTMTGLLNTDDISVVDKERQDTLKAMETWANPEGKEQSFGGKVVGMAATLPAQLAAMPLSPFDTAQTLADAGETTGSQTTGAILDTAGNVAGFGLPGMIGKTLVKKVASGAVINAVQDTATRAGISVQAETDKAKQIFSPTIETAALAAIPGAGIAGAHHYFSKSKPTDSVDPTKEGGGTDIPDSFVDKAKRTSDKLVEAELKDLTKEQKDLDFEIRQAKMNKNEKEFHELSVKKLEVEDRIKEIEVEKANRAMDAASRADVAAAKERYASRDSTTITHRREANPGIMDLAKELGVSYERARALIDEDVKHRGPDSGEPPDWNQVGKRLDQINKKIEPLSERVISVLDTIGEPHRNDSLIINFLKKAEETSNSEKQSSPSSWSKEQIDAYDRGDWKEFSRLRGYTKEEIAAYDEFLTLLKQVDEKYGDNFAEQLDYLLDQTKKKPLSKQDERQTTIDAEYEPIRKIASDIETRVTEKLGIENLDYASGQRGVDRTLADVLDSIATAYGLKQGVDGDIPKITHKDNYVDILEVPKDWQGKGLGTQLVKQLEQDIYNNGKESVFLMATPESRGFWEKMGYKKESDFAPEQTGENVLMYKDLNESRVDNLPTEGKTFPDKREDITLNNQVLGKVEGTNLKISSVFPKELRGLFFNFVKKLGFTKDDISIVYATEVGGKPIDRAGITIKDNKFIIYYNDLAITKQFDQIMESMPEMRILYWNIVAEKQHIFRHAMVIAHEMGHIFFYKMAHSYWNHPMKVAELIRKYVNFMKARPDLAKMTSYIAPEQFMGKIKFAGDIPGKAERLLSFKEYWANQVAKEILYANEVGWKKGFVDESFEQGSRLAELGKEQTTFKDSSIRDEEGNLTGETRTTATTKTKVESEYMGQAKEGNTRYRIFGEHMIRLARGMKDFLDDLMDQVGLKGTFKPGNFRENTFITEGLIKSIIKRNDQLDSLGKTVWEEFDDKAMGYGFRAGQTLQKTKEDMYGLANYSQGYVHYTYNVVGGTYERVIPAKDIDTSIIDSYPSVMDAVDIAKSKFGMMKDIPKVSAYFTRQLFGKNTNAGIWYDNPIIQATRGVISNAQRLGTQIHHKLLYGDTTYGKSFGPLVTLNKIISGDAAYYVLKHTKTDDVVHVMDYLRSKYDFNAPEPKSITNWRKTKGVKVTQQIIDDIIADYQDISKGANFTPEQQKFYDSMTKMWANQWAELANAQKGMNKAHVLPYHRGWYPAMRSGNFFVTLQMNGRSVYAQYFRTKELGEQWLRKFNSLSNKKGLSASTVLDRPQGDSPQAGVELSRLYQQELRNAGFPGGAFEIENILQRMQIFGGKLGKHHEHRYNLDGYAGSELFKTKEELGNSWKRAIEDSVSETTNIIKKMQITHDLTPILQDASLKQSHPNTIKTVEMMNDMATNKVHVKTKEIDDWIDAKFEKMYLEITRPVRQGLNKAGFKSVNPDYVPDKSVFKTAHGNAGTLFYIWGLMSRPAFWAGQALTPITTIPRVLLREDGMVGSMMTMGKAWMTMLHPDKEFAEAVAKIAQERDTFHPQFINDFNKLSWLDKIIPQERARRMFEWFTGQAESTMLDAFSRYWSFTTAWEHNKKMGLSADALIEKSVDMTGEMAVLYGRAEKAPIFEQMGTAGEMMSPLQTFSQAQLGNLVADIRRAKNEHNVKPLVATFLMTMLMGGVMGTPLVAEYEFFRRALGLDEYLPSAIEWALGGEDFSDRVVSHGVVSASTTAVSEEGFDVGSSLRWNPILAGILIGDRTFLDLFPAVGFATDIAGAVGTSIKAQYGDVPEEERRDAALTLTPGGYKSIVDYAKYDSDTRKWVPDKKGDAVTAQTSDQITAQALGTRTLKTAREKEIIRQRDLDMKTQNVRVTKQVNMLANAIIKDDTESFKKALTKIHELGLTDKELMGMMKTELKNRNIPEYIRKKYGTALGMSYGKMRNVQAYEELENE